MIHKELPNITGNLAELKLYEDECLLAPEIHQPSPPLPEPTASEKEQIREGMNQKPKSDIYTYHAPKGEQTSTGSNAALPRKIVTFHLNEVPAKAPKQTRPQAA